MKKRSRELLVTDITPLIDVVFLLLIFFMVSTVFKKDELALLLNLPKVEKGEAASSTNQDFLTIELSLESLALNGKKMDFDELYSSVKDQKDKKIPVEMRVDKEVKYERVVKLIEILKKVQLTNLSLITEK